MSHTAPHSHPPWIARIRQPLFWVLFYAVVIAAWTALYLMARAKPLMLGDAADFWASLCLSAAQIDPFALYAMWVLMAAAMMLPGFVPALRVFGDIAQVNASDTHSMVALVAGYAAIWLGFSTVATRLQILLSQAGWLAPDGTSLSPWLTALLLLAAGAYQLSLVKAACLSKCRHPLVFFLQYWKPGPAPAFRMGLRLGMYCVGCCWALMTLGFIGGAMNLLWMGATTLFMTFEKLPDIGTRLTKPAGLILLALGVWMSVQALQPI